MKRRDPFFGGCRDVAGDPMVTPESVAQRYAALQELDHEVLMVVAVNSRNAPVVERVFVGGSAHVEASVKDVLLTAFKNPRTSGLMFVHNHPSGDTTPSLADIQFTRALVDGANLLGLRVLDHVVLGDGRWVSMKALGMGGIS